MSTETKKLCVDRIEEGIAIAYDTDGNEYCMCERIADIQESDVLLATVNENGAVVDVRIQREETEEEKQILHSRLHSLFQNKGE